MNNSTPFISKSKYLSGLQCHKLLWHQYNAKDKIPQVDSGTQSIFDQGHLVGSLAKKLYPNGIEVAQGVIEHEKVIEDTQKLIQKCVPLFEAAFRYKSAYARVDILNPVSADAWEIIEVKSSTSIKEVNLHDLSVQWYVYQGAGLKITRCSVMHINSKYIREGDIDPKGLFSLTDVTDKVLELLPQVESRLEEMSIVIAAKAAPAILIGLQCEDPYPCQLQKMCFSFLPEHNPLTLYRLSDKKAFALIYEGMTDILRIDETVKLSDKQKIQIESVRANKALIDQTGISAFLKTLEYPLYYLDFETIGPAIPLFDDSSPYQQIPFQFSLHIQASPVSKPEHFGYLAEGRNDPRPEFLRLLKANLGDRGSIVTYNDSFEKDKLKRACQAFPEYEAWNKGIQSRIVDLLDPFQAFYYYHYGQRGSASIKAVLPALTGKGYEGMPIADGGTASNEYLRVTFGEGVTDNERETVRKNLEEYCKLDTLAMVEIIEKLREMV